MTFLSYSCVSKLTISLAGLGLGLELKNSKEATTDAIEEARLGVTQAHEVVVPTEFKVGTAVKFQVPGTDPDEPGTNPDEPASSFDLKTKMGNPIRPDRSLDKIKLTSELPDSAFAELERIQVEGVAGRINFKTQGFGRYSAPDSRCGSVVIVYTTMGSVQFDGTSMMVRGLSIARVQRHPPIPPARIYHRSLTHLWWLPLHLVPLVSSERNLLRDF